VLVSEPTTACVVAFADRAEDWHVEETPDFVRGLRAEINATLAAPRSLLRPLPDLLDHLSQRHTEGA